MKGPDESRMYQRAVLQVGLSGSRIKRICEWRQIIGHPRMTKPVLRVGLGAYSRCTFQNSQREIDSTHNIIITAVSNIAYLSHINKHTRARTRDN